MLLKILTYYIILNITPQKYINIIKSIGNIIKLFIK
jgi:hypothetical protein